MASDNRHPTGDTGTGAVIGNRRIRTAQDLVADVADVEDVAAEETEITAEAAVGEGEMVQTPPPPPPPTHTHTKTDRKLGAADRTDAKEVGRRRGEDRLRGMGKRLWGQPSAPT